MGYNTIFKPLAYTTVIKIPNPTTVAKWSLSLPEFNITVISFFSLREWEQSHSLRFCKAKTGLTNISQSSCAWNQSQ